jgi:hypothetical protein
MKALVDELAKDTETCVHQLKQTSNNKKHDRPSGGEHENEIPRKHDAPVTCCSQSDIHQRWGQPEVLATTLTRLMKCLGFDTSRLEDPSSPHAGGGHKPEIAERVANLVNKNPHNWRNVRELFVDLAILCCGLPELSQKHAENYSQKGETHPVAMSREKILKVVRKELEDAMENQSLDSRSTEKDLQGVLQKTDLNAHTRKKALSVIMDKKRENAQATAKSLKEALKSNGIDSQSAKKAVDAVTKNKGLDAETTEKALKHIKNDIVLPPYVHRIIYNFCINCQVSKCDMSKHTALASLYDILCKQKELRETVHCVYLMKNYVCDLTPHQLPGLDQDAKDKMNGAFQNLVCQLLAEDKELETKTVKKNMEHMHRYLCSILEQRGTHHADVQRGVTSSSPFSDSKDVQGGGKGKNQQKGKGKGKKQKKQPGAKSGNTNKGRGEKSREKGASASAASEEKKFDEASNSKKRGRGSPQGAPRASDIEDEKDKAAVPFHIPSDADTLRSLGLGVDRKGNAAPAQEDKQDNEDDDGSVEIDSDNEDNDGSVEIDSDNEDNGGSAEKDSDNDEFEGGIEGMREMIAKYRKEVHQGGNGTLSGGSVFPATVSSRGGYKVMPNTQEQLDGSNGHRIRLPA